MVTAISTLVLWDVDHTLIETRGVGRELYERAFLRVTGEILAHDVEITGRTELAIVAEALRSHSIEPSKHLLDAYCAELVRQYQTHIDDLRARGRALPGAGEAVAAVAAVPGFVQTVLTGNLRDVAIVKLNAFGLGQHLDLDLGAYADDSSERSRLVIVAQERARAKYGATFGRDNTVVVGDTVNDVVAARAGGARRRSRNGSGVPGDTA